MKKISETLAGRAVYVQLPPFTWAERMGVNQGDTLDILSNSGSAKDAVFVGGYPPCPGRPRRPGTLPRPGRLGPPRS